MTGFYLSHEGNLYDVVVSGRTWMGWFAHRLSGRQGFPNFVLRDDNDFIQKLTPIDEDHPEMVKYRLSLSVERIDA